jgi:hypothetical protein
MFDAAGGSGLVGRGHLVGEERASEDQQRYLLIAPQQPRHSIQIEGRFIFRGINAFKIVGTGFAHSERKRRLRAWYLSSSGA